MPKTQSRIGDIDHIPAAAFLSHLQNNKTETIPMHLPPSMYRTISRNSERTIIPVDERREVPKASASTDLSPRPPLRTIHVLTGDSDHSSSPPSLLSSRSLQKSSLRKKNKSSSTSSVQRKQKSSRRPPKNTDKTQRVLVDETDLRKQRESRETKQSSSAQRQTPCCVSWDESVVFNGVSARVAAKKLSVYERCVSFADHITVVG